MILRRIEIFRFAVLTVLVAQFLAHAAWVSGKQDSMDYKFFVPDTSSVSGKIPIVFYLHPNGWQGNADGTVNNIDKDTLPNVLSRPANQSVRPCYILAPECPVTNPGGKVQWNYWVWFNSNNIGWGPEVYSINSNQINFSRAEWAVSILNTLIGQNPRIDTNRIYIAGGSMGGYGTFYTICKYPAKFACATALSGAGDTSRAKLLTDLPIWIYWGTADGICPPAGSQNMVDAITRAGGSPNFKAFSGAGHLWNQVWASNQSTYYQSDLIPWMFRQSKSSTGAASDQPRSIAANLLHVNIAANEGAISVISAVQASVTVLTSSGRLVAVRQVVAGRKAEIGIPTGCAGILHVQVSHGANTFARSVLVN